MAFSLTETDCAEAAVGCRFPLLYRKLLQRFGPGKLGAGREIYDPREIESLFGPFFEECEQLFTVYFPFGCDNRLQEVWVVDMERELAASIWHETVPEDWADEDWLDFHDWEQRYLTAVK